MNLPCEREEKNLPVSELLSVGKEIIEKEAKALEYAASSMGNEVVDAAHLLSRCHGRVVVSGLGKSGHVGRKTAAT